MYSLNSHFLKTHYEFWVGHNSISTLALYCYAQLVSMASEPRQSFLKTGEEMTKLYPRGEKPYYSRRVYFGSQFEVPSSIERKHRGKRAGHILYAQSGSTVSLMQIPNLLFPLFSRRPEATECCCYIYGALTTSVKHPNKHSQRVVFQVTLNICQIYRQD